MAESAKKHAHDFKKIGFSQTKVQPSKSFLLTCCSRRCKLQDFVGNDEVRNDPEGH